jgi:hypothetical protein
VLVVDFVVVAVDAISEELVKELVMIPIATT